MAHGEIYGFDCGTTNWRMYRLGFAEKDGVREPVGQPGRVALMTFTGTAYLPAALLLDEAGDLLCYGNNAYQQARDPANRTGLRDAFKLCIGNREPLDALSPSRRYTHADALAYTRLLLAKLMEQFEKERPGRLEAPNLFYFAHPVHWGRELPGGGIEGELLTEFAAMVRSCFPSAARERVHFIAEPEAALLNLARSGEVQPDRLTLVVDVGGGTTDLAVGLWTREGLRQFDTRGGPCGSNLYDQDLAGVVADQLNIPETLREGLWTELCHDGRDLKVALNGQLDWSAALNFVVQMPGHEPPYFAGNVTLDRAGFERVTSGTSSRFSDLIKDSLLDMEVRLSDIQQVVLVGGGANLYQVPELLRKLFKDKTKVAFGGEPEEAIVKGAVWRAIAKAKAEPMSPPKPTPDRPAESSIQTKTPPLPPSVPNIHSWPAEQVQALQKQAADALGKPVVFRDRMNSGGEGPEMVVIPAGTFLMGSPSSEPGRSKDEGPQHFVTFAKSFAMGRYAVTFDEYDRFCLAAGLPIPDDNGWGRGRQPVINVTWGDAQAYCAWLSEQTGKRYRLPSEAEWEYACRAGATGAYSRGVSITPQQANYDGSGLFGGLFGASENYRKRTVPVDQFQPNDFGLFQMHGNVCEWCEDPWHGDYTDAPVDGSVWMGGEDSRRVNRGGSWNYRPDFVRAAFRGWVDPTWRFNILGFRLAQDL